MRFLGSLAAAFWLIAAAPPPPAPLTPYIKDGRFDPGDYGWMRGRFDGASPADKAASDAVRLWLDRCFETGLELTRAELRAMGIAEPKLERSDFREPLCASVAAANSLDREVKVRSFAEFQRAAEAARPVAETFLLATEMAESLAGPRGPSLSDKLLARPLGEQMLRIALSWGEGAMNRAPALPADARAVLLSRLAAAAAERDRANTAWLKTLVEKEGWPTRSKVGEAAAERAWLLVQHADADPAFQLKALRMMEPLARSGEVSKSNYAYLYDRVMLKLTGRQRYATQAECVGAKRAAQPVEDERIVARERAAMGLEPLADYLASLQRTFGDCPPGP